MCHQINLRKFLHHHYYQPNATQDRIGQENQITQKKSSMADVIKMFCDNKNIK